MWVELGYARGGGDERLSIGGVGTCVIEVYDETTGRSTLHCG